GGPSARDSIFFDANAVPQRPLAVRSGEIAHPSHTLRTFVAVARCQSPARRRLRQLLGAAGFATQTIICQMVAGPPAPAAPTRGGLGAGARVVPIGAHPVCPPCPFFRHQINYGAGSHRQAGPARRAPGPQTPSPRGSPQPPYSPVRGGSLTLRAVPVSG